MKKSLKLSILYISVFFLLSCTYVNAEDSADENQQLLDEYTEFYGDIFEDGLSGMENGNSFAEAIPELNIRNLMSALNRGELSAQPRDVLNYILKCLLGEVYASARLMALILALSVLSSYLGGFGSTVRDSVSECAFYVCYIVIAGIASAAFYEAAQCTASAVDNAAYFMRIVVPVMITALLTGGAAISAASLEPALLTIVEIAVWVIDTVFVPAVMISAALNIVNGLSDRFKTDRMVKLVNSAVKWGMSIMLTVFVSIAGLKSIASSGADGLTLKLSKFAASNLIPMVGGILSESVETVMNCSALIKNTVGIAGIICLAAIVMQPLLKLGAVLILFRVTAAVAEPVSDSKIIVCVSRLGDSVAVLFSMLAAVTVMFIMVVTIMINTGNSVMMFGR